MDKDVVSMRTRVEVTKRLRQAYRNGSKKEKGLALDTFQEATGLSRVTARRYLTSKTIGNPKVFRLDYRKARPRKYSDNSRKLLTHVWRLMGMPCGQYMAACMRLWVDSLKAHGELVYGKKSFTKETEAELLAMSGATIDRYLKAERDKLALKGYSGTKPGTLLRSSISVRRAGDETEGEPGFLELDTVWHCGPVEKGEFARTLTLTDVYTGWIHLEVMRNNARKHMLGALERAEKAVPFQILGFDCDNGSEFINYAVVDWVKNHDLFFTRSRPYRKNDQAHVESKNNHAVRKYGFYWRYDTEEERQVLALLWKAVCLKLNYFTPTKKPVEWVEDNTGRRKRKYDEPATPLDRLIASGCLSRPQIKELTSIRDRINPAELTRDIVRYQSKLTSYAKAKTELLAAQEQDKKQQRQNRYTTGIKVKTA